MSDTFDTHSPEETERIGELLGRSLRGDEVLAFSGGLGMGKTAFVRGLARGLGSDEAVSSPTFALVNQYGGGRAELIHFDMYRISGWADLYSTGFYDYLGAGVIAIEWSENMESELPADAVRIRIARGTSDSDRRITIQWPESRRETAQKMHQAVDAEKEAGAK